MFISSTRRLTPQQNRKLRNTKPKQTEPDKAAQQRDEVRVPFKEHAVTSSIVGASLGTMMGEKIGELGVIGGVSYLGYAIGSSFGQAEIGGIVGGIAGAGVGYVAESKLPIGKTVGGAAGFISGGLIGGITGAVIAGASSILSLNPFQ